MKNSKPKIFLSSAETIGGNLDILIQILLRLPAKSLLKFKCVSKQFLSLISDPKFCVCHARHQKSHNPTPNALLLNRNFSPFPQSQVVPLKDTTQVPPLDFLNPRLVKIENSCNGLLLCASRVLLYSDIEDYSIEVQEYFICNPTTRQFRRLPFPDYIPAGSAVPDLGPFLSLSFDPLKSPHYKVIYLHYLGVDLENLTYNFVLDVYSSEIESWTPTPIPFPYLCGIVMRAGVFCNGAVHWPVIGRPSLYFVVDDYKLKTMPMPPVPHVSRLNHFGESLGHLHMVVSNDRNILPLQFDVWEMASDYSGWFVRYHVDLSSVRAVLSNQRWHHGTILTEFSVLSIIRAGKEEESKIILLHDAGRAMSYNPHDGTTRKLCHLESIGGSSRLDYEGLDGYEYFETLACV